MSNKRRAEARHGKPAKGDVAIAFLHPGTTDGMFTSCLAQLQLWDANHDRRVGTVIAAESGPRIARVRNDVAATFLQSTECDWLLTIDSDMTFQPALLDELLSCAQLEDNPRVIGGLCFAGGRGHRTHPTIYLAMEKDDGTFDYEVPLTYPEHALIKVNGTGAACMLVHRTVLVDMLKEAGEGAVSPWYEEGGVVNGHDVGEDILFCMRAERAGHGIYVHTGIKLGHRKKYEMDEETFFDYVKQLDEVNGDETVLAKRRLAKLGVVTP